MRWALRDPLAALLTISGAALAAILMLELRPGPAVPVQTDTTRQGAAEEGEPLAASPSPTLSLPPPDTFTEMVERPLFNPSRRPHERDGGNGMGTGSALAAASRDDIRLVLTAVIIHGEDRLALLRNREAGEILSVRAGERVGSWSLAEVHADRVVLEKQGSRVTLALRRFESGPDGAGRRKDGSGRTHENGAMRPDGRAGGGTD